jgi:hypothetical protein
MKIAFPKYCFPIKAMELKLEAALRAYNIASFIGH